MGKALADGASWPGMDLDLKRETGFAFRVFKAHESQRVAVERTGRWSQDGGASGEPWKLVGSPGGIATASPINSDLHEGKDLTGLVHCCSPRARPGARPGASDTSSCDHTKGEQAPSSAHSSQ